MVTDLNRLTEICRNARNEGKKIVFTNGVFDILHRGHAEYLSRSKELGDVLVVGINGDSSVKRLKGDNRPVNCESDRAFLVDSLKPVDHTVVFYEDTPYNIIKLIIPDILVKGGDYDPDVSDRNDKRYIVGSDIVRNNGGKVVSVPLVPKRSTTDTINKLRAAGPAAGNE